jgi:hypothetical protein
MHVVRQVPDLRAAPAAHAGVLMPVFIRPGRVVIDEGGGSGVARVLLALVCCAAVGALGAVIEAWVYVVLVAVYAAVLPSVWATVRLVRYGQVRRVIPAAGNGGWALGGPVTILVVKPAELEERTIRRNGGSMITGSGHQGGNQANAPVHGSGQE